METTWFHDLYTSGGSALAALLGLYTYWRTSKAAERRDMIETIKRQEEEIKALKDENRLLGRENVRLLREIAKIDHNWRH